MYAVFLNFKQNSELTTQEINETCTENSKRLKSPDTKTDSLLFKIECVSRQFEEIQKQLGNNLKRKREFRDNERNGQQALQVKKPGNKPFIHRHRS